MDYGEPKESRKNKKSYDKLLDLLKKHFSEDDMDMLSDDDDEMNDMPKMMGMKHGESYYDSEYPDDPDMEYDGEEEEYEGVDISECGMEAYPEFVAQK